MTIDIPRMAFSQNVSLGFNDLKRVYIPNTYKPSNNDTAYNCGIHVTSFLPISVYTLSAQSATTDASCVFPTNVQPPGGKFYISNPKVYGSGYNSANNCGIVAIDDSVTVEITPTVNTRAGLAWGQKYKKKLYQGQVYLISSSTKVNLEGTLVQASPGKRVAVFSGDVCVAIRCAACDHVYEQIPPTTTLGKRFIITPFVNQQNGYDYQIVATENSTTIKENGVAQTTINAGETFYRKVMGDSSFCIESDKPVLLVQFMTGKSCQAPVGGDPAMLVISPLEQTISYAMVSTSNTTLVKDHYITIVVPKSAIDSVYLDGSLISRADFDTAGCGDYFFFRSTVTPGNHRIQCRFGFSCYIYGIGGFESYAYSAGSGMRNLQRYIVGESYPSCDSGFIVKVRSIGDSATSFRWTFNNNQIDTARAPFFSVAKPGIFPVKLLYKLLNKNTWDSTSTDILVEKPKYSDFITFDSKTICDTAYTLILPNTSIFNYTWNTGQKTSSIRVNKTGKYKVKIENKVTGCTTWDSCYLSFFNPVKVDFAYRMTSFCPGIPLYLYDSSKTNNDSIISRAWYADKYLISLNKNDTIKSPRANKYEIKLVINTSNGCMDSTSKEILISDIPIAKCGIKKLDTCFGSNLIRFNNGSTVNVGRITRLKWLFGNGDTASGIQPIKSFKDSGTFFYRLIAFSEGGCFDTSDAQYFTIYPKPQARMQIVDSSVCLKNNYFDFRNASIKDGRAQTSTWLWGDGNGTFLDQLGTLGFDDTGVHEMKLIASFKQTGCGDTVSRKVRVWPNPKASLAVDSFNYCLNRNYYLFRNTTAKPAGAVEKVAWDWGDGTSTADSLAFKKVFSSSGTFRVSMFYSLGKGCNDTTRKNVIVYQSPKASFVITDSNICGAGNYYKILNNSVAAGNARWAWNFGDGNTSNLKNPGDLRYSTFGRYSVTLRVTEPLTGCVDTFIRKVNPISFPVLKPIIRDTARCFPSDSFSFTDSTAYAGIAPARLWKFEDGSSDTAVKIIRQFTKAGIHSIQLIGGKPGICADTTTFSVRVRYDKNPLKMTLSPRSFCAPAIVNLAASGGKAGWNYEWHDPVRNRRMTGQQWLNVGFTSAGVYPIILTAQDDLPCSFEYSDTIKVHAVPQSKAILLSADKQCLSGNSFSFSATVTNGVSPYTYNWDYGDSTNSALASPAGKKYNYSGAKIIRLIVNDKNNCSDTQWLYTAVFPMPRTTIHNDSGCTGTPASILASNTLPASSISSVDWEISGSKVFTGNPFKDKFGVAGISIIRAITTTVDGCKDTSGNASLISYPEPEAAFGVLIKNATGLGIPVEFTDSSKNASGIRWIPEKNITNTLPSFTYVYKQLGRVTAWLIATNSYGCADTATRSFELFSGTDGWVPSAFTPDGNSKNDYFTIGGLSAVSKFEMKIFNRWGQKVFETNQPEKGWDGMFGGNEAAQGIYAYEINIVYFNGIRRVFTGNFSLLR